MSELLNKNQANTALVTGASRGIGRAIALELAQNGYHLIITCKNDTAGLDKTAAQLESYPVSCMKFVGDMGDYREVARLFEEIKRCGAGTAGRSFISMPSVLVNNAGISMVGLFQDMTPDEWNTILASNLTSVYNCCHFVLPAMIQAQRGKIINISSVWGNVGASCEVAYSATKGAVNALTRALAKEVAPSHISVNALACGAIDTSMNRHLSDAEKLQLCDEIPVGRMGTAAEVAHAVMLLVGAPEYVTGQVIKIDGGWT